MAGFFCLFFFPEMTDIYLLFLLEYNCFTMLCQFLLYNEESAMCIHISPPSWTSLPPPIIPPIQVITEQGAELCELYSRFPLAVYFTHGSVFMSNLISQFIPSSPPPAVFTHPFPTSAFLFLPWKLVHLYRFSRFHIHALIYDICFGTHILTPSWYDLGSKDI